MKLAYRWLVAMILAGSVLGCSGQSGEPKEPEHLEGTPQDLQILRVEGIRDPDSEAGQRRLRQLKKDREALDCR